MIEELRIQGLGVIDDASIGLGPGLTAITGETGAGKTMLLTGLALVTGGKADAGVVRSGVQTAWVDSSWIVDADNPAIVRVREAGGEAEANGSDVSLLLGRSVAAEGRSRASAGGRSVPVSVLQEASASLLAVHGQSDQLHLRSAEAQRELLDRFGGAPVARALDEFRAAFADWGAAARELRELRATRDERARAAAELERGMAEIDLVDPQPDEDVELDARASRLQHSGALAVDARAAHDALVGSVDADDLGNALQWAVQARQALDRARVMDPHLDDASARAAELAALIADLAADLASYQASIDADPQQQAAVEERRSALATLRRHYGATIGEVIAWRERARATVDQTAGDDARIAELEAHEASRLQRLQASAQDLTAKRVEAARRLSDAVTAELAALAMPDAAVEVRVETDADVVRWSGHGADRVEFTLRPHRGGDFRPVAKSASGGELSRVMLAIEVCLAGTDPVPTFVFDEIDAGIGGRAAIEVGRRLARLARTAQVIVVTHLPQVAAFADSHVVVRKDAAGLVTTSCVTPVTGPERIAELVRLLSGLDATEAGTAHAEELLALADQERSTKRTRARR